MKTNTDIDYAKMVIELEVCGMRRDAGPVCNQRIETMTIQEAEDIAGITVEEATVIMETEGTIF